MSGEDAHSCFDLGKSIDVMFAGLEKLLNEDKSVIREGIKKAKVDLIKAIRHDFDPMFAKP